MIKKVALLILIIIASVSVLVSCGEKTDVTTAKGSPIVDPDNTSKEHGYEVSSKRYAYKKYDTVLLNVKNTSDKNCTITVTVNFFKEDGTMFRSSTQTFEGLAVGCSKSFFYNPRITFDSYTYTVEAKEYNGECLTQYLQVYADDDPFVIERTPIDRDKDGHNIWGEGLFIKINENNTYSGNLYYNATVLIIDNQGKVHSMFGGYGSNYVPTGKGTSHVHIKDPITGRDISAPKGELVIPDELKDGATVIIVLNKVDTELFRL